MHENEYLIELEELYVEVIKLTKQFLNQLDRKDSNIARDLVINHSVIVKVTSHYLNGTLIIKKDKKVQEKIIQEYNSYKKQYKVALELNEFILDKTINQSSKLLLLSNCLQKIAKIDTQ